ncbi:MAG TPA: ATP-binding protein [Pyrinomonadaceae bacterium]|nr:ATP-binding protein [Pyrinomonadaceae bacterium]
MNNDLNNWQQNNQRYLSAAVAWLRLRLRRLAQQPAEHAVLFSPEPDQPEPIEGSKWRFWDKPEPSANQPRALLPPAPDGSVVTAEQLAQATKELEAAEAAPPAPAMILLSQSFNLSKFEREILLLCAAMEMDTGIAALCANAQSNNQQPYPTFALAMLLFDDPAWNALSPESPLRHWRLIEINQPGAQLLTTSALRADERIVNFLKGLNYLDDRLSTLLLPMRPPMGLSEAGLPSSQQRVVQAILDRLQQGQASSIPVIQLIGSDVASKQLIAQKVVAALGLQLYRLPAELMPAHAGELEMLARLAERETALWPLAIYLEAHPADREKPADSFAHIDRFLARNHGVVFLDGRELRRELSCETITIDVARPTPAEQRIAWATALEPESNGLAGMLASQFNLSLTTIQQVASSALLEVGKDPTARGAQLWKACLAATRPALDGLAERIEPKASWDDIVLPESEIKLLTQIAAQVRNRGKVYEAGGFAATRSRGLSLNALFAGESGTGKTMAAEVLANDLQLGLYRIDLSSVVNKYIGETEKNLRRLFDAAEEGGAILFFDEADALFGKRSEVKDSHDRYANIEINYLLQRLEAYTGLAIMATNMKGALDTAFLRRIRFILEFRAHSQTERALIWRKVFPRQTETLGLDYERLAKLNLNGGSINNVAINAAFLAAQADTPVTMPLVLEAARTEFLKLKRPLSEADFQWLEPVTAAQARAGAAA